MASPSSRWPDGTLARRRALRAGAALALAPWAAAPVIAAVDRPAWLDLLAEGGLVVAFRHALAPGTFDPPGFRLGDCGTQRNLSDDGRAQARRIGQWFAARALRPEPVRSSPWCRCLDTARLAFGRADAWAALGSPRGAPETTNAESLQALRAAVAAAAARPGRLEVWVTHMFVLADLTGESTASGEALILQGGRGAAATAAPRVVGRLRID